MFSWQSYGPQYYRELAVLQLSYYELHMAALSSTDFCTVNRKMPEIAFSDGNHDGREAET